MTDPFVYPDPNRTEGVAGIAALRTDIAALFEAWNVSANVVLGRRERAKQVNQGEGGANRVVLQPGDESGAFGKLVGPRGPGGNPRPLFDWLQLVNVYVWGVDKTDPTNEEKQFLATYDLLRWTMRAIQRSAAASGVSSSVRIMPAPVERAFGVELLIALELRDSITDVTYPVVTPTPVVNRAEETP